MSTLNNIPDQFLTTFEVNSGTNVLPNEYNWDVPHEYLYCFNVNDDEIMTKAIEESTPGLVEIVDMEWIAYTGPQNSNTDMPPVEPPLRRLLDLNYYKEKKKPSSTKIRRPYNAYTSYKIQCLIDLVFLCGYSARKVGLELGLAVRTAQHYYYQYRLDEDKVLPGKKASTYFTPVEFEIISE
ncbi:hypothetical protein BDC45DRAFT_542505 [Circinella umbellata]|nr:hypothetical protein BDC45DRAFT_542505 [Circinella umbellata]